MEPKRYLVEAMDYAVGVSEHRCSEGPYVRYDDPAIIEDRAIAQAARAAGLVKDGKLLPYVTSTCSTSGRWEDTVFVPKSTKLVYFMVPIEAAEAAKGGGDAQG
jgi:hypothetical protein